MKNDSSRRRLFEAFAALDAAGVRWCLLRGLDSLGEPGEDTDVLIAPGERVRAEAAVANLGFVTQRAWGHAPHRFWVAATTDASTERVKLDLVTSLRFGRPVRHLEVDLAARCLSNRRRRGQVWVLAPDDEFTALLLHALLDKPEPSAAHRDRLAALWDEAGTHEGRQVLGQRVEHCTRGAVPATVLARALVERDWDDLLARRTQLARRLFWDAPAPATWWTVRSLAARRAAAVMRHVYGRPHV
jgi:hypothetical protein